MMSRMETLDRPVMGTFSAVRYISLMTSQKMVLTAHDALVTVWKLPIADIKVKIMRRSSATFAASVMLAVSPEKVDLGNGSRCRGGISLKEGVG